MKCFWHVLKTDLRRLAVPLELLAVVLVVSNLETSLGEATENGVLSLIGYFAILLQWVLTVILAAEAVLGDPPRGSTAFWLTRPLLRKQVVGAKLAFLTILIAVPLAMQTAELAYEGAGWRAVAVGGVSAFLSRALLVVGTAAFAVTAESFGQFLINALLVLIASGMAALCGTIAAHALRSAAGPTGVEGTLVQAGMLAAKAVGLTLGFAIVLWRYLKRHPRFAVPVVAVGAVVSMLTPTFWRWDYFEALRSARHGSPIQESNVVFGINDGRFARIGPAVWAFSGTVNSPQDAGGNVIIPMAAGPVRLHSNEGALEWSTPAATLQVLPGGRLYAPEALQKAVGAVKILGLPGRFLPELQLQGVPAAEGENLDSEQISVRGRIAAAVFHYRIVAELPAKAGSWQPVGFGRYTVTSVHLLPSGGYVSVQAAAFISPISQALESGQDGLIGSDMSETFIHTSGITVARNGADKAESVSMPEIRFGSICLLVNRARGLAIFPTTNRLPHTLRAIHTAGGSFMIRSYGLEFRNPIVASDWLRQASLVFLDLSQVGTATGTVREELSDGSFDR